MEIIRRNRRNICKFLKLVNGAAIFIWFGMFYVGSKPLRDFSYNHYFLYDKCAMFIFCYIIWLNSKGFVRYLYCAVSAFMAVRVFWGLIDEIDSSKANSDELIYPLHGMLIIVSFGILTAVAEWKQRKPVV